MKLSEEMIMRYLPDTPNDTYSFEVHQFSATTYRVVLNHHHPYDYACGKPVWSVWGFVRGVKGVPMVFPAMSSIKPHRTPVMGLREAYTLPSYSATIHNVKSLMHL